MILSRRRALAGGLSLLTLSACSPGGFGIGGFGGGTKPADDSMNLPLAAGQSFGNGPVRVAMLLPLSGDPSITTVGQSMQNGAQLAMEYIAGNANLHDNITLVVKDTGASAQGAAAAANQAVQEGASLILGPLKAEQVTSAGAVARAAGLSLIGFSNNSGAAEPGVFLLNVLPEAEVRRSMSYALSKGKKAFAGVFVTDGFGQIQQSAFQQAATDLGASIKAVYQVDRGESADAGMAQANSAVTQLGPFIQSGEIDTVFLPDRRTAPSIANLLMQTGITPEAVLLVGSADWNDDPAILAAVSLNGAVFPAVDDQGYQAILPLYQQRFGGTPHPFVTIAYTAVVLANAPSLAMGTPRYDRALLTAPAGFNGRDGVFRFLPDGRSQYALVIKKVSQGGASVVDGAKI